MKEKRYKFIVMYQALPKKSGEERRIDRKLEASIKRLLKPYGYKFIGSGYDFTNDRRDMEFWAVRKEQK